MEGGPPEDLLELWIQRLREALTPLAHQLRERAEAVEHLCQGLMGVMRSPGLRVEAFGSSASGLCLPDSDLDLGLLGHWVDPNMPLHLLHRQGQLDLLNLLSRDIPRMGLADGRVERVLRARVPLLKFVCRNSGLECDLSIQGPEGILKARVMSALATCDSTLPNLYRLVKVWAAAHNVNDASQGTLNSTALLLMVVFYLQHPITGASGLKGPLLPPIQWLVQGGAVEDLRVEQPEGPLALVTGRLLEKEQHGLWSDPLVLEELTQYMAGQAAKWRSHRAAVQQQYQQQQQQPTSGQAGSGHLADLLHGFFSFWAEKTHAWIAGTLAHRANTWAGQWSPGGWARDYVFSIEDPFDRFDNPARAVRCVPTKRVGEARRIANALREAAAAIRRFKQFKEGNTAAATTSSSSNSITTYQGDGGVPVVPGTVRVGAQEAYSPWAPAAAAAGDGGADFSGALSNGGGDVEEELEAAAAAGTLAQYSEQLAAEAVDADGMSNSGPQVGGDSAIMGDADRQEDEEEQEQEEEAAASGAGGTLPVDLIVAAHAAAESALGLMTGSGNGKASSTAVEVPAAVGAGAGVGAVTLAASGGAEGFRVGWFGSVKGVTMVNSTSSSSVRMQEEHVESVLQVEDGADVQGGNTGGRLQQQQQQEREHVVRSPWPKTQQQALCKCLVELFGPHLVWRMGCCGPLANAAAVAGATKQVAKGRAAAAAVVAAATAGGAHCAGAVAAGGGLDGQKLLRELFKAEWLQQFEGVVESTKWTEPSLGLWMLATLAGRKPKQLKPKQAPPQRKQPGEQQQQKQTGGKVAAGAPGQHQLQQANDQEGQASSSTGSRKSARQQQQQQQQDQQHELEGEGQGGEADGNAEAEGLEAESPTHTEACRIRAILNSVLRKLHLGRVTIQGSKHQEGNTAGAAASGGCTKRKFKLVLPAAAAWQTLEGFVLPGRKFSLISSKKAALEQLTVMAAEWIVQQPEWRQMLVAKERWGTFEEALERYKELAAAQQQQQQQEQQPPKQQQREEQQQEQQSQQQRQPKDQRQRQQLGQQRQVARGNDSSVEGQHQQQQQQQAPRRNQPGQRPAVQLRQEGGSEAQGHSSRQDRAVQQQEQQTRGRNVANHPSSRQDQVVQQQQEERGRNRAQGQSTGHDQVGQQRQQQGGQNQQKGKSSIPEQAGQDTKPRRQHLRQQQRSQG